MTVLAWLLETSWKGAVVVAVVLAVQALFRRSLPPALRHALWLLVLVRLLLPALPESRWSVFRLTPAHPGGVAPLPGLGDWPLLGGAERSAAAAAETVGTADLDLAGLLLAAWLAGVLVSAIRLLVASHRLRAALARGRPVADPEVLALLEDGRRTLGLRRPVAILETPAVATPALHGFERPTVLLPEGLAADLDRSQLRHILLHELGHVRRRDGLVNVFATLAGLLHWFNPVVRYALHRLQADRELACDALVLSRLSAAERPGYGRTLIAILARGRARGRARGPALRAGLAGLLEDKRQLTRRVAMIAAYRSPSRRRSLAFLALAAALAFLTLTDVPAVGGAATPLAQGASSAPEAEEDKAKLKGTVATLRTVGTAMFAWLTDARAQGAAAGGGETEEGEPVTEMDWGQCPRISRDDLTALLVPRYLAELPAADAWGHDLEFCLDRAHPERASLVAGLRSPGRDGRFSGSTYPIGPFPATATDRDLVWLDGYFITWPEPAAQAVE